MKAALIVLLSVLLLTQAQAERATGLTTSSPRTSSDSRSSTPQKHHPQSGYNQNIDEEIDAILTIVFIVYVIVALAFFAISGFLLFRCWRKSQERQKIKDLMRQRRYEYATSMGMNLFQINNDNRHNYVMHV